MIISNKKYMNQKKMSCRRQREQNGGKPKYFQKLVAQEKHLKMKLLSEFNLHHKVLGMKFYCKYLQT